MYVNELYASDAPVRFIDSDKSGEAPEEGVALCLSGGGYRAMLFHAGALIRLNEAGMLKKLSRVSSVSGGSITAAVLGLKWAKLGFGADNVAVALMDEVVSPIRDLASKTIDVPSVLKGLLPFGTIAGRVAAAYDKTLFKGATLQDLPSDAEGPRFVINATNVQSGALWRFSRPYMGDYLVGRIPNPTLSLAVALGASSAFPPVLSPAALELSPADFTMDDGCPLGTEAYKRRVYLSDGGVYDNLGLETAWKNFKTVLVSDGGQKMGPDADPSDDWVLHGLRVSSIVDNQVRSLRKRQLIDSFKVSGGPYSRKGAYWGIRADIRNYGLADSLPCPEDRTLALAATPTRLCALDDSLQERLINWGYAVCDAALRRHVDAGISRPAGIPYQAAGV
jgi:NTE family protein